MVDLAGDGGLHELVDDTHAGVISETGSLCKLLLPVYRVPAREYIWR